MCSIGRMRFIVWVGKYLIYPTIYMRQLGMVDQLVSSLSRLRRRQLRSDFDQERELINSLNEG
jgi:hypothetical protein